MHFSGPLRLGDQKDTPGDTRDIPMQAIRLPRVSQLTGSPKFPDPVAFAQAHS